MFSPAGESLRSSVFRLVNFSKPSGIAKRQKRNNRCIAHTFRERLYVAASQAELGQSGDLGEDGVGLIFLSKGAAATQTEVLELQVLEAFGDCDRNRHKSEWFRDGSG